MKRRTSKTWLAVGASVLAYAVLFVPLYPLLGPPAAALCALPVFVTGWLFGGDEFAALLERVDAGGATRLAVRISETLGTPFAIKGTEVVVTASVGVSLSAPCAREGDEPEYLLRDADAAMYHAKRAGKARHEIFDPDCCRVEVLDRLEV